MSQQSFAAVSVSTAIAWGVFFYPPPAPAPAAAPAAAPTVVTAAPVAAVPQQAPLHAAAKAELEATSLNQARAAGPSDATLEQPKA